MATTLDLINRTLRHLQANAPQPANRLNGAINNSAASITFKYPLKDIVPGVIIAAELEEMRVWETDGSNTATVVERGVNGSTAAAHVDLTDVLVKPRFSWFGILGALNNDINDLSAPDSGLYQVKFVDFVFESGVRAYDLDGITAEEDVLSVQFQSPNTLSAAWPHVPAQDWMVDRDQDTTAFPSGFALTFTYGGSVGQTYRVLYKAPFVTLPIGSLTTDVADTGLPTTAYDLPPLGAALELMAGREIKRNFTESQGDSRRATEVPAGAVNASVQGLLRQRQRRLNSEASRLSARHPVYTRTR